MTSYLKRYGIKRRMLAVTAILIVASFNFWSHLSSLRLPNTTSRDNPFATTTKSVDNYSSWYIEETANNSRWDTMHYVSGIFGHDTTPERDVWIRKQCFDSSVYGIVHSGQVKYNNDDNGKQTTIHDRCTRISSFPNGKDVDDEGMGYSQTNATSCCFCYKRYPDFVDGDERWSFHYDQLQSTPKDDSTTYWFCMGGPVEESNTKHTELHQQSDPPTVRNRSDVVLVTGKWGHNDQFQNGVTTVCDNLKQTAQATGFLDPENVYCYYDETVFEQGGEDELDSYQKFKKKHLQYRNNPDDASKLGGGLWFHKSLAIYHHMLLSDDDSYIIYMDLDREFFLQSDHFYEIIARMDDRNADIAIEEMTGAYEIAWTKQDMISAFKNGSELPWSSQMNAGTIIVRNSPQMRHFVKNMYIECMADFHMVSNEESIIPNDPIFIENRHDQSVIGILVKQYFINKRMIGPPVMLYFDHDAFYTFQLPPVQNNPDTNYTEISCPFGQHRDYLFDVAVERLAQSKQQIKEMETKLVATEQRIQELESTRNETSTEQQ